MSEARFDLAGGFPSGSLPILTQPANDQFNVTPIHHRRLGPPRPKAIRIFGQSRARQPDGFRRHASGGLFLFGWRAHDLKIVVQLDEISKSNLPPRPVITGHPRILFSFPDWHVY
jgi:hypothetical protein